MAQFSITKQQEMQDKMNAANESGQSSSITTPPNQRRRSSLWQSMSSSMFRNSSDEINQARGFNAEGFEGAAAKFDESFGSSALFDEIHHAPHKSDARRRESNEMGLDALRYMT